MTKKVTLYLPGIYGPSEIITDLKSHDYGAFKTILSRASMQKILRSDRAVLGSFFEGFSEPVSDTALIGYYQNQLAQHTKGSVCQATIIRCLVDHRRGYFLEKVPLSSAIQEHLSRFFHEEGVQAVSMGESYMIEVPEAYQAVTLSELRAKGSLLPPMPSGPDASYWKRLITSSQLFLQEVMRKKNHSSENIFYSLWFQELSALPQSLRTPFDAIISDDPAFLGAARYSHTSFLKAQPLSVRLLAPFKQVLVADRRLLHYTKEAEWGLWRSHLERCEAEWFRPALYAVKKKKWHAFELITEKTSFLFTRRHPYLFWKNKTLSTLLTSEK